MKNGQQRNVRELKSEYIEQHESNIKLKSQSKKGLVRRLSALGVFVVVVLVMTVITLHSQNSVLEKKLEKKYVLEQELAQLHLEERDLKDEIGKLHDMEYISEIARRDYYLTKPGEIIFKVTPNSSD